MSTPPTQQKDTLAKCKGCDEKIKMCYLTPDQLCYKCDKEKKIKQQTNENEIKSTEANELTDKNNTICNNCGTLLKKEALFCGNCGKKVEEVTLDRDHFCTNCGKKTSTEEKFCSGCGNSQTNENNEREDVKKLKPWILLLLAVGGYILGTTIGGTIGTTFNAMATLCTIFAVIRFVSGLKK